MGKQNGNYMYTTDITANFLPLINTSDIIKQILGKTPTAVDSYLTTIPGYTHAQIKIIPPLPGPLRTIPHLPGNITIEISPDQ